MHTKVKEALRFILGQLGDEDRFSIVSFDHQIDNFSQELRPAESNAIWEAMNYVY